MMRRRRMVRWSGVGCRVSAVGKGSRFSCDVPTPDSRDPRASLESRSMKSVIVIPARWASSRFPGKPLAMIAGVSLIQRVYERAAKSARASAIFVATDDDRIADHIATFGGRFVRPEGVFQSGTDRIAASL